MAGMDKMGKNGAANGQKAKESKLARFGRTKQGIDYDWRTFSDPLFGAALGTLASSGAAVMVGGAAGGRGAVVSIYLDGDKDRRYLNSGEDLVEWCHDVLEAFSNPSEDVYAAYGLEPRGDA